MVHRPLLPRQKSKLLPPLPSDVAYLDDTVYITSTGRDNGLPCGISQAFSSGEAGSVIRLTSSLACKQDAIAAVSPITNLSTCVLLSSKIFPMSGNEYFVSGKKIFKSSSPKLTFLASVAVGKGPCSIGDMPKGGSGHYGEILEASPYVLVVHSSETGKKAETAVLKASVGSELNVTTSYAYFNSSSQLYKLYIGVHYKPVPSTSGTVEIWKNDQFLPAYPAYV